MPDPSARVPAAAPAPEPSPLAGLLGVLVVRLQESMPLRLLFVLACLAAVALLDFLTGIEVGFSVFYLIPIGIVSWLGRRVEALVLVMLSGLSVLTINVLSLTPHLALHNFTPAVAVWNALVESALFTISSLGIMEIRRGFERERRYGYTDYLTGLLNRRGFQDQAAREVNRCQRHQQALTVAFLDCDNFKQCNDRFGHEVGDEVLRKVADTIHSHIRQSDLAARLGGDEFVLLLPGAAPAMAVDALRRLHQALNAVMHDCGWPVTFSIGAITAPLVHEPVDELVQAADRTMLLAKQAGKNAVRHQMMPQAAG